MRPRSTVPIVGGVNQSNGADLLRRGLEAQERGNLAEATELCRQAAEAGYAPAYFDLGYLYNEQGDLEKAIAWWQKSADRGDQFSGQQITLEALSRAQRELAAGDRSQAARWYGVAADRGSSTAMINLGSLAKNADDADLAISWWQKAGEAGDHDGFWNCARLADERGRLGEAYDWYVRAAESRGYGYRQTALQSAGEVAERQGEVEKAISCYSDRSQAQHYPSLLRLGYIYADQGRPAEAVTKFADAEAAYATGGWSSAGLRGVHVAAMRKFVEVLELAGQLDARSQEWQRLAGSGVPGAAFMLGMAYHHWRNDVRAAEWWTRAAEAEFQAAFDALKEPRPESE